MKILIISPKNRTIYNFRGELIKEIINKGHEVYVTGPNHDFMEKINELGVTFIHIDFKKTGLNPFNDFKYYRKLVACMKDIKPDIVFGYTIKPVIYGSLAASKIRLTNIYSMITGVGYTFTSKSLKARIIKVVVKILYRASLKVSKKVIFQNPDDELEFLSNKLLTKDKAFVVNGSGVDMTKFHFKEYPDKITFLMVARIIKTKGVVEYLKAANIVKKKYPFVKFMLLGRIEVMPESLNYDYIRNYIDRDIIEYFEETECVQNFYSKASVFVLPSYREGTPRTVLEAMSMKRPIITTDTPGCKETVINGYNGYLVGVKDIDGLVSSILNFIEHPERILSMGENSYKYCKEKFDVKNVNSKMLDILDL